MLDDIRQLNEINDKQFGDPEIVTRVRQYEMAYRMQTSVPELTDQGNLSRENYSRDHHPRCFTMWMAGGGIKPGCPMATDDYSYSITENPLHVMT